MNAQPGPRTQFTQQSILITGAGSGIGRALALELGDRGALVWATDLDLASAEQTASEVHQRKGRCEASCLDVRDLAAWQSLVAQLGQPDCLINNAGVGVGGETQHLSAADWKHVLDVNLMGAINGVQAVYPAMVARRAGRIVNVASAGGLAPYPLALPYTTSKHALVGLSLALRAEAHGHGVKVNVACPGAIKTAIWQKSESRSGWNREAALAQIPLWMSAQTCAQRIVRGILADQPVIEVTLETKVMSALQRLSPRGSVWLHQKLAAQIRRVAAGEGEG